MFQYSTSTAMINMINLFMIIYSWYNCLMQVTSVLNISITHLWGWRWSRRWLDGEAWVPRHRLWRLLWCRICWVLAPNILAIEIGEWYPQGFPAFGNAAVGLDCKEVFLWCNFVLLEMRHRHWLMLMIARKLMADLFHIQKQVPANLRFLLRQSPRQITRIWILFAFCLWYRISTGWLLFTSTKMVRMVFHYFSQSIYLNSRWWYLFFNLSYIKLKITCSLKLG